MTACGVVFFPDFERSSAAVPRPRPFCPVDLHRNIKIFVRRPSANKSGASAVFRLVRVSVVRGNDMMGETCGRSQAPRTGVKAS